MTVHIKEQRISSSNFFGKSGMIAFNDAWKQIEPRLVGAEVKEIGKITLLALKESEQDFRFNDMQELAVELIEVSRSGSRKNKFFDEESDNKNIAPVIYRSKIPRNSNGWNNAELFENLGDDRHPRMLSERMLSKSLYIAAKAQDAPPQILGYLKRRAEQEYIMQSIAKGPLAEACNISTNRGIGIAIRPTSVLAHMGIESGAPTKSQEFKNKTSKDVDAILCEELQKKDVGAVVHYDPRVGWTSRKAKQQSAWKARLDSRLHKFLAFQPSAYAKDEWKKKLALLVKQGGQFDDDKKKALEKQFYARLAEYLEEDYEYRWGHYAPYTELVGPCVRLKVRPKDNMYGDHDLFVFTSGITYGKIMRNADATTGIQTDLQRANAFQAQHGGIWYWEPRGDFNMGIRQTIMGAHSQQGPEPLVLIMPGNRVSAAFYVAGLGERLQSVWDFPRSTDWLMTTRSGKYVWKILNA